MEVSGQLHSSAALPPGNELPVLVGRRKSRYGRSVQMKNLLLLPGLEPRFVTVGQSSQKLAHTLPGDTISPHFVLRKRKVNFFSWQVTVASSICFSIRCMSDYPFSTEEHSWQMNSDWSAAESQLYLIGMEEIRSEQDPSLLSILWQFN
jgi:hypothetical protein